MLASVVPPNSPVFIRLPLGSGSAPTAAAKEPKSIAGLYGKAEFVTQTPLETNPAGLSRWKSNAPELKNFGSAVMLCVHPGAARAKSEIVSTSEAIKTDGKKMLRVPMSVLPASMPMP